MTKVGDLYGYGLTPDPFIAAEPDVPGDAHLTQYKVAKKAVVDYDIRCGGKRADPQNPGTQIACGKLLAECAGRPWRVRCGRCKKVNRSTEE